jgi:gamma-glutamyltranspeptidase/glutathione hydrolase
MHLQLEAMKLAFADAFKYVSDPLTMDIDYKNLVDPAYLKERAKLIDPDKANMPRCGAPEKGNTVYLTAADAEGMMVSFIQSNYWGFGSGIVIPDTGISMQNRGAGFVLDKDHPNQADGNKRPFHTIIPGFVTDNGKPLMSFGVMGGHMQTQGHAQVMIRMFDYNQNPQTALDAPRWQVFQDFKVGLEKGIKSEVIDDLKSRGHIITDTEQWGYGGGQVIFKTEDGYISGSDPRKDGQAVGF